MVDFFQNVPGMSGTRVHQSNGASPVRLVHDTSGNPVQPRANEPGADAAAQAHPLKKVEDKVDLKIEPEAVRQLRPNTHLKFLVSEDSNRVIVQIIQSDTNTVLREVPPKSLTEALAALNSRFTK